MGEDGKKLETVYERIWETHGGERFGALDRSLGPRPPDMLFDAPLNLDRRAP